MTSKPITRLGVEHTLPGTGFRPPTGRELLAAAARRFNCEPKLPPLTDEQRARVAHEPLRTARQWRARAEWIRGRYARRSEIEGGEWGSLMYWADEWEERYR